MSEHLRFLVTVDAASGAPMKVEQVGEAGDLTEVDLPSFVRSLGGAGASPQTQPQVVINIFGGAAVESHAAGTESPQPPASPPWCLSPPITPPPRNPPGGKRKRK